MGQPLVHRNSLLKLLKKSLSHNTLSAYVPLKEIRIQRDSINTKHNERSGFCRSIETVKESLNQLHLSLHLTSIEAHFFPELSTNSFCSGAPRRGAQVVSIFYISSSAIELFHAYTKNKIGLHFSNHHRVSALVMNKKRGIVWIDRTKWKMIPVNFSEAWKLKKITNSISSSPLLGFSASRLFFYLRVLGRTSSCIFDGRNSG